MLVRQNCRAKTSQRRVQHSGEPAPRRIGSVIESDGQACGGMSLRLRAGVRRLISQHPVHLTEETVALVFGQSEDAPPNVLFDRRPVVPMPLGGLETDGREGEEYRVRPWSIVHI